MYSIKSERLKRIRLSDTWTAFSFPSLTNFWKVGREICKNSTVFLAFKYSYCGGLIGLVFRLAKAVLTMPCIISATCSNVKTTKFVLGISLV